MAMMFSGGDSFFAMPLFHAFYRRLIRAAADAYALDAVFRHHAAIYDGTLLFRYFF